jgi:hypothetical protein
MGLPPIFPFSALAAAFFGVEMLPSSAAASEVDTAIVLLPFPFVSAKYNLLLGYTQQFPKVFY